MPYAGTTGFSAGGIVTSLQNFVTIKGKPLAPAPPFPSGSAVLVSGSTVAAHGSGLHASATMSPKPGFFFTIEGVPVICVEDSATCGDTLVANTLDDFVNVIP